MNVPVLQLKKTPAQRRMGKQRADVPVVGEQRMEKQIVDVPFLQFPEIVEVCMAIPHGACFRAHF